MSLVAVGSAKGSPGVTTLVAALGALWPGPGGVLLAELDPAGGDLGIRLGLPAEPGLVTLAAEGRRGVTPELVWGHTSPFPASEVAHVLPGPASADQATAALAAVGGKLAGVLADLDDADVVADCGRLDPGSPALGVAQRADLVVVVARPSVAEIRHLSARVAALRLSVPVALVLVGDRPYGVAEVAGAVGVQALGAVAHDERGAELVHAGALERSRRARTSALVRTSRSLAETLVARLGSPVASTAPAGSPAQGDVIKPPADDAAPTTVPVRVPAPAPAPWQLQIPPSTGPDPQPVGSEAALAEAPAPSPVGGRRPPAGRPRRSRPLQSPNRSADGPGAPGHEADADSGSHDRGGHR